jgi:hypothetical protein
MVHSLLLLFKNVNDEMSEKRLRHMSPKYPMIILKNREIKERA